MCRPGSRLGEISTKTVDESQIHAVPAVRNRSTTPLLYLLTRLPDSHGYNVWPPVGDNPLVLLSCSLER